MHLSHDEHNSDIIGDLPDPGIKPGSPALQADSLPAELQGKPRWQVDRQMTSLDLEHGF